MGSFFEDWGQYSAGALPTGSSEDWEEIWNTGVDRTVQEDGGAQYGGKILQVQSTTAARQCLRSNVAPTSEGIWEVVGRVRGSRVDATNDAAQGFHLRAGGAASSESSYMSSLHTSDIDNLRLTRYNAGSGATIASHSVGFAPHGLWLFMRHKVSGGTHQMAIRSNLANLYDSDNPGNAPAGGWDLTHTEAGAPTTGAFGIRGQQTVVTHWYDWLGVAWGGDVVPIAPEVVGDPAEIRVQLLLSDFSGLTLPKTVRYAIFSDPLVNQWEAPVLKGNDGEIDENGLFVLDVQGFFVPTDLVYIYLTDSDGTVSPLRHHGGPVIVTEPA